jgi:DNA invertase Pin-like site-specific DNA recombinase
MTVYGIVGFTMKTAIYARISTKNNGQDTENQLRELRAYCKKMNWTITKVYVDQASGSKANRDQFQVLFTDSHQRKFDLVLFWALDRFSREGALETLKHLERLTSYGVAWKSYTEQYLDSAGIFKDAIISIMATLAKQERVKISERTIAGLQTARAKGKKLGRPKKVFDRAKLILQRKKGHSLGQLAGEFGISRTHVARLTKAVGRVS